ncbi:HD-GYP domain-containing protein [Butyrivibrio sp. VCD2006]|uniref:HD-GYP domain-containing protein n=1 Tax=Butyrivibrio sp. VCD2006 TaxID=1280664 RepID=UPI0003F55E67|nr:HD domain-containing phosphohydrolase [Butyrivibrio sp. VCD2006]
MKKILSEFFYKYKANKQKILEIEQYLYEEMAFNRWRDVLIERSSITREIYKDNNKFLADIKEYLQDGVNEDIANELFKIANGFYNEGYDDLFVIRHLAEPAIDFYEKTNNYDKLCYLYKIMGYELFEFYGRINKEFGSDQAVDYYEKLIGLKDHYAEIRDPKARVGFFVAYNNLISPIGQTSDEYKKRMFRYYNEAMELWEKDYVQDLDGDSEDFTFCISQIENEILFAVEFIEEMPEDFIKQFFDLIPHIKEKWEKNNIPDEGDALFRAEIKKRMLNGESYESLIEDLIERINNSGELDFEKDQDGSLTKALSNYNNACTIFDIFKYYNVDKNICQKYIDRFCKKVTDLQRHLPFGYFPELVEALCSEWFKAYASYIEDSNEKKELLLKLVIARQPMTYIHSLMVSEIAVRIAYAIIKDMPTFFAGIPEYPDIQSVKENQKDLIDYITDCGLLHDCGKCTIVSVVSRQDRHLYDEEFAIIKRHPTDGYEMLGHDPNFKRFFDIIRGHHKNYDGKSGYPDDFDNTKSPYKPVIDLISIADSIDAATDILGRNYTKGKDFQKVFEELQAGAGTRYCPEIVGLIEQNRGLYNDLTYLTSEGRFEIYYRAYKEILYI